MSKEQNNLEAPYTGVGIPVELLRVDNADPDSKVVTLAVNSFREVLLVKMSEAYNTPGMEPERLDMIRHSLVTLYRYTKKIEVSQTAKGLQWNVEIIAEDKTIEGQVKAILGNGLTKAIVYLVLGIEPPKKKAPKKRQTPQISPSNKFPLALSHSTATHPAGQLELFPARILEEIKDAANNPSHPDTKVYGDFTITKPLEPKHYRMRDAIIALAPTAEDVRRGDRLALTLSVYKLAQVYSAEEQPRQSDFDMVIECIEDFRRPEYWARIRWTYEEPDKKGKRRIKVTDAYVDPEPLIKLINRQVEYTDENGTETKTGIVLQIHSVFVNPDRYTLVPGDLISRMKRAWGKPRTEIPAYVYILRDTLLYHIAASTKSALDICKETLYPRMFPKYHQEKRVALMNRHFTDAADTMQRLGLITGWREAKGAKGQSKLVFTFDRPGWNRICSRPAKGEVVTRPNAESDAT